MTLHIPLSWNPRNLSWLGLLVGAWLLMGCGGGTSQVTFSVVSVSPGQDGSFTNRCCGFTVKPKAIFMVLGDVHMLKEAPANDPTSFASLAPLLKPEDPDPQPEEIGNNGKFPGLWAINILKGAAIHNFPTGTVEAGSWKQVQIRMSPAGSRVRGTSSAPTISGKTLLFEGTATKDKIVCNFRMNISFELGVARQVNFDIQPELVYRNTIEIDYSTWFDDVRFQNICPADTTQVLEITNSSQPQIIENIKTAIPSSISVKIGAGTAE